jgi:cytochrome c biogenesis protein CcdA
MAAADAAACLVKLPAGRAAELLAAMSPAALALMPADKAAALGGGVAVAAGRRRWSWRSCRRSALLMLPRRSLHLL